MFHVPLLAGDTVMLAFSERDISRFKQTLQAGPPLTDEVMPDTGAVAFPVRFAAPATVRDGMAIQTYDGETFLSVSEGRVTVHAATIVLEGDVVISGGVLTDDGADVGSSHTHGGVSSGPSRTGTPG